ncbi:MAG: hypothetical protein K6A23_14100, partial [Butyrivibrio sp.]|nr:hypothetical protein [Butyrivibrio sp.]
MKGKKLSFLLAMTVVMASTACSSEVPDTSNENVGESVVSTDAGNSETGDSNENAGSAETSAENTDSAESGESALDSGDGTLEAKAPAFMVSSDYYYEYYDDEDYSNPVFTGHVNKLKLRDES